MQTLKKVQVIKSRNGFEFTVGFTGDIYVQSLIRFGDDAKQTAAAFREFADIIETMKELQ